MGVVVLELTVLALLNLLQLQSIRTRGPHSLVPKRGVYFPGKSWEVILWQDTRKGC